MLYDNGGGKDEFTKHLIGYHAQSGRISYSKFIVPRRCLGKSYRTANEPEILETSCQLAMSSYSASDTVSNTSFVLDSLEDLRSINESFDNTEVSDETRCFADLSASTLRHFWAIDFILHRFIERCVIKDVKAELLRKVFPDWPSMHMTIPTVLSKLRRNEDLERKIDIFLDVYYREIHLTETLTAISRSPENGVWVWTLPLQSSDVPSRKVFTEKPLGRAISIRNLQPEIENALSLSSGQIVWVLRRDRQGWLYALDHKALKFGLVPEKMACLFQDSHGDFHSFDGEVDILDPPPLMADTTGASALTLQNRVRSWLCQIFRSSRMIRVLTSRNSAQVNVEYPYTIEWVWSFLKQLDVPSEEVYASEEAMLLQSSDGAIDSRDDLISDQAKMVMGVKHIFARLNLTQYLDRFIEEGFDSWDAVCQITEADLDALNVKFGHRRILQFAITESKRATRKSWSKFESKFENNFPSALSKQRRSFRDTSRELHGGLQFGSHDEDDANDGSVDDEDDLSESF